MFRVLFKIRRLLFQDPVDGLTPGSGRHTVEGLLGNLSNHLYRGGRCSRADHVVGQVTGGGPRWRGPGPARRTAVRENLLSEGVAHMKVAVVGGGSTYSPELVDGFARLRDQLDVAELVLVDP